MNRREFLTTAGALAALRPSLNGTSPAAPAMTIGSVTLNPPRIDKPVKPERAASLKRLLAEAKTGARPRLGMTRIDGYTTEKDDVILWGRNELGREELVFDDLVIALRSIRGRYGKGTPGVGLDFRRELTPDMIKERGDADLKRDNDLNALRNKSDAVYKVACMQVPLYTRVYALQRDSDMARYLLDADFLLKKTTGGYSNLKVKDPHLNPLGVWSLAQAKVLDGNASQVDKDAVNAVLHTFGTITFKPGRMSYIRDENSIFIDCVQVLLEAKNWKDGTTEVMVSPIYQDFAYTWTNHMEEIIPTEPHLMKMQGAFRAFALARILEQNHELTHLSDRQVIEDYLVPMVGVPDHYDSQVTTFQVPSKKPIRKRTCGGVLIPYYRTAPSSDVITSDVRNDIALSGRKAIDTMRSCTGSCGNVE
jgi:hypothetical protein